MDGSASQRRPASGVRRWTLTVTMEGFGGGGLLRLASVFHRRRVDILSASYAQVGIQTRMVATVETTEQRLRTLALTLRNTIGVTGHGISPEDEMAKEPR